MYIVQNNDNTYSVLLENTNVIVIFWNLDTKEAQTKANSLKELLNCTYLRNSEFTYNFNNFKRELDSEGRRWKSLKFCIANELNWSKSTLAQYLRDSRNRRKRR